MRDCGGAIACLQGIAHELRVRAYFLYNILYNYIVCFLSFFQFIAN